MSRCQQTRLPAIECMLASCVKCRRAAMGHFNLDMLYINTHQRTGDTFRPSSQNTRTAGPSAACLSEQAHLQALLSRRPPLLAASVQEVSAASTCSLGQQQLQHRIHALHDTIDAENGWAVAGADVESCAKRLIFDKSVSSMNFDRTHRTMQTIVFQGQCFMDIHCSGNHQSLSWLKRVSIQA